MKYAIVSLFALSLMAACSDQQIQTAQTDVGKVATAVQTACNAVNGTAAMVQASPVALIPQVSGVIPYVTAACGTAEAVTVMVSKAVNDPTTVSWIENLDTSLKADIAQVKAL